MKDAVEAVVAQSLRPLIEADGGMVEVILADASQIVLQLSGACSGCPGLTYTQFDVIVPLLRARFGDDLTIEVRRGPARALSLPPAAPAASDR